MRPQDVFEKAQSDESGFTLVEVLIAGIIGGIVLTMMALMFTSFVQSDRAARDTVDAVVGTNEASRHFHEMMRTANAFVLVNANGGRVEVNSSLGGRELRVERSDGTCETWVGLDTQNTVLVLTGDNARDFNRAIGNRGSLILRVYSDEGSIRKDFSYGDVRREGAEWFSYTQNEGVEFNFRNQASSNREMMSGMVIPRVLAERNSTCW